MAASYSRAFVDLRSILSTLLWLFATATPLVAQDMVEFSREGVTSTLEGEVVVESQDGGYLFRTPDNILWLIQPDEVVARMRSQQTFNLFELDEFESRVNASLPRDFKVYKTAHYWICHDTSLAYAQWVGSLYERLYAGFYIYWKNQKIELKEPELPLVIYVFRDRSGFAEYASKDFGGDPGTAIGYYHMLTNRVVTYDLTGSQSASNRRSTPTLSQINRSLSQPAALRMVATIVHEATHQLSFNSGLQTRFSDLPFWVGEGLAIYFEAPDLKSRKGWRGIGNVNRSRLSQFQRYMPKRDADSLIRLIEDDQRFRSADQVLDAYAEAWALNHYLLRTQPAQYLQYLLMLSDKKPMIQDGPEARVDQFKEYFGDDLQAFDREFLRYIQRLR